jgi:hypothetical protein
MLVTLLKAFFTHFPLYIHVMLPLFLSSFDWFIFCLYFIGRVEGWKLCIKNSEYLKQVNCAVGEMKTVSAVVVGCSVQRICAHGYV